MGHAKTDIWMPFYPGDYLRDTMRLTTIQHGIYLLMLLDYWCKGEPLPDCDEQIASVIKLPVGEWARHKATMAKFFDVRDGFWWHKRVEMELKSARETRARLGERGRKGGKALWEGKGGCLKHASSKPEASPSPSPSPSPSVQLIMGAPSLEEVVKYAEGIGLGEWKARDWFEEMEGCGWRDYSNRPIQSWKAVLNRVRTKWEADGRPSGPGRKRVYESKTGGKAGGGNPSRNKGTANDGAESQYE